MALIIRSAVLAVTIWTCCQSELGVILTILTGSSIQLVDVVMVNLSHKDDTNVMPWQVSRFCGDETRATKHKI
jgi:hypothetical protein